ncbi:MAG: hypothetical protein JWP69_1488 [Flaviaesturariibacter sp.]|nr:hypothetical protein [Flaviaesturariibacter sp.]
MKHIFFLAICFLAACNSESVDKPGDESVHASATDTIPVGAKLVILDGCYAVQTAKDTATLSLQLKDSTVTGQLVYKWFEKDQNKGTINGVLRDSLVYADYTFESEGITSVRQVIFKIQNNQLLEATGERTQRDNKIVYSNPSNLRFSEMPPFRKIACQ